MKIHTQPEQMGGVWANAAAVRHSPHEFTIDFLRCDFDDAGKAAAGILVQRVNMSPLLITQLITALQENWSNYASKALPQELIGDAVIDPDVLRHEHPADNIDDPGTDDTDGPAA